MRFDLEKLYELLPAMYRLGDHTLVDNENDIPPLKALLSVIADEVGHLEENLDQLYDDQFIETCAEWVIPYIGQLIGSRELIPIPNPTFTRRAEVANTIAYRRRKGTASIIEQLARDVCNWDTNVLEYFQLLTTTQYLNHLRPQNVAVSSLKDWKTLEYANTPFDSMPKTVDVRNISNRRGKYNIPNIGIFLWRIKAYASGNSPAKKIGKLKYTFDPLGMDVPLYNKPLVEKSITQIAGPLNVAMPISRKVMRENIALYYGSKEKLLIKVDTDEIATEIVCSGNLKDWKAPPKDKVIIDPELGRIMFGEDVLPAPKVDNVKVYYHYGFSTDMGGGEYAREHTFSNLDEIKTVSGENIPSDTNHFNKIQDAIDDLTSKNISGVVEVLDNRVYKEDLNINPVAGATIEIRAKNACRPILKLTTKLTINGKDLASVIFNGLLIDGGNIEILPSSKMKSLKLIHCTVKPHKTNNQLIVKSSSADLHIEKSIVAGIRLVEDTSIQISDSIIDVKSDSQKAIKGLANDFSAISIIKNSTIIGEVYVKSMELAENDIFYSRVFSKRLQHGCIRFSYLPLASITPPKYKCQPDNETSSINIRPSFTSLEFGNPAYGQLDEHCRPEITTGADDESEMGAYHDIYQPQRIANLRTRLNEYLRFGMEAGIFYAS